MKNADAFSSYHPAVTFLYFTLVLIFSMCFMHLACLAISLFCALGYCVYLKGAKNLRLALCWLLPMLVLVVVINAAFNHEGATILRYFPNGNPLTLESVIYGFAAAVMLCAVILWFFCYNEVMTSDKFIYLFGRIIPALSLVLSMTLRFVPRFAEQIKTVSAARRCMGRGTDAKKLFIRIKNAAAILSIVITWSLENAIETADSMKSRGYGLKGRTAYSIYRFDDRDRQLLLWLTFCGVFIISGWIDGGLSFRYFPTIKAAELTAFPVCFLLAYLALCLTPLILNAREDRLWKHLA